MSGIGIPCKLMHEAEGHIVTVELKNGETYRGKLLEAEDNMNAQLQDVTFTARDGRVGKLETVYIRGSKIRFLVLPDMLKNAPMFKKAITAAVRGRAAAVRTGPKGRGRGAPAAAGAPARK